MGPHAAVLQVSTGRGSIVRGLLRGQCTEEVTLAFTDGFMRDILYHRTMHSLRRHLHARAASCLQRFVQEDESRRKLHAKKLRAVTERSGLARRAAHLAARLGESAHASRLTNEWQSCRVLLAALLANPWRPLLPAFLRVKRERDKHRYRHLMFGGKYDEADRHYKRAFETTRKSDASSLSRGSDGGRSQKSRKLARRQTRISLMAGLQSTAAAEQPRQHHHNEGRKGRRGSLSKHVSDSASARVAVEVVYSAVLAADEAARTMKRASGDGVAGIHGTVQSDSDRRRPNVSGATKGGRSEAIVPFQSEDRLVDRPSHSRLPSANTADGSHQLARVLSDGSMRSRGKASTRNSEMSARSSIDSNGSPLLAMEAAYPSQAAQAKSRHSGGGTHVPRADSDIAGVDPMRELDPLDWRRRMRQDLRGRFIGGFGHQSSKDAGNSHGGTVASSGAVGAAESDDIFRSLRDTNATGRRSSAPSLEQGHSLLVAGSGHDLLDAMKLEQGSTTPGSTGTNSRERHGRSSLPQLSLRSPQSANGLISGARRLS